MPALREHFLHTLLLSSALAIVALEASSACAQERVVTVVLTEYKFVPDRLALQHGMRYRLRLENRGGELHEFTAPMFFKTAEIANPEVMNADRTDVVLQPHESKDLVLVPRQIGSYDLTCADHDWEGMVGKITVE